MSLEKQMCCVCVCVNMHTFHDNKTQTNTRSWATDAVTEARASYFLSAMYSLVNGKDMVFILAHTHVHLH